MLLFWESYFLGLAFFFLSFLLQLYLHGLKFTIEECIYTWGGAQLCKPLQFLSGAVLIYMTIGLHLCTWYLNGSSKLLVA